MKTKALFLSLLMIAPIFGCNKEHTFDSPKESGPQETGIICITLDGDDGGTTKALSAYTEAKDYETKINSVQLLLFNGDGDLVKDVSFTSSFTSMQTTVPTGTYSVVAMVNKDLSCVYSIDELSDMEAYSANLTDNSISGKSFVMYGQSQCTVNANTTSTCPITVKRIVGRVALHAINCEVPEGYEFYLRCAFLSNVNAESCVTGTPTYSGYYDVVWENPFCYNYDGYNKLEVDIDEDWVISNRGSIINDASDAQQPTFTAFDFEYYNMYQGDSWTRESVLGDGDTHVLLYGCPNGYTGEPNGRHNNYADQKTCLVVCADVYSGFGNGGTNYYTIPLDSFEANKTYTIDLTVTGFGSTDPNKPVQKGSMTASVTVSGWSAGSIIEKTI